MQELHQPHGRTYHLESAVRSELEQVDRRFCEMMSRGDVEKAAREVYTSDAVILPPGAEMVRGRDSIVEFWKDAATALSLEKIELSTVELQKAGDFVFQIGRAVLTVGGQQVEGKYTLLWKQESGRWKWHVDCWNLDS